MADSLVHYYQSKLSDLRVIELKQILTQVGGSKKGVKQDLVDRILMLLQEDYDLRKDDVAKQIDQTYKKMYVSKSEKTKNVGPKKPEIRCVCGIPSKTAGMIKCEDQSCGVWQHAACVVIPVNPNDGIASAAKPFYCELCRLARSNPFSVALPENVLLHSVKLSSDSDVISKVFTLTSAMKDLLSQPEYDIQAWCMLLNDGVLFRVHWPKHVDLKINGVQVQPTSRLGSWQLGANGRDDAVNIAQFTKVGNNCICFAARDDRPFCLGVRLVRRRTVEQVMELIPRESDGEELEEAVARVSRCLGGGGDLEVVADFVPVNLRCPMSGLRMKVAGRFKPCVHMGCFDLEVFVEMNMRSKKWQCPVCLKNYCLDNLIIDPYFNCIVSRLQNLGQDVNEVEVRPDGSWRIKSSVPLGWHAPDGSLMEVVSNRRELGDAEVVVLIDDSEDEQKEPMVLCDETDDGVTREKDDLLDLLAEEGSNILSGMKDEASVKRGRERSDSPFSSFPTKRQRCR